MKKIISIKLARALRANIIAINLCMQNMTDELAHVDIQQNPQDPNNPADQLTDAQAVAGQIERASEALARADGMLASQVADSKIYSQPPAPVAWLMRQLQRINGGVHE